MSLFKDVIDEDRLRDMLLSVLNGASHIAESKKLRVRGSISLVLDMDLVDKDREEPARSEWVVEIRDK